MKTFSLMLCCLLAVLLVGCGKKAPTMEPMGANAPQFGTAEMMDLPKFLAGKWCLVTDAGVEKERFYEFAADGTFKCGGHEDGWTGTGKYLIQNNAAYLTYETIKGKPMQQFISDYKKDEEGGGQVSIARALMYDNLFAELGKLTTVWVDSDKTHLTFSDPNQKVEGDLGNLMNAMAHAQLERLGPAKS